MVTEKNSSFRVRFQGMGDCTLNHYYLSGSDAKLSRRPVCCQPVA